MKLADLIRAAWVELTTPDNFRDDPYTALVNQIGHIGLGMVAAVIAACAYFHLAGEMPVRLYAGLILSAMYLLFELVVQGYKGNDTYYDWSFVSLGIALPYISLTEISYHGDYSLLRVNIDQMLIGLAACVALLAIYTVPRIMRKYRK